MKKFKDVFLPILAVFVIGLLIFSVYRDRSAKMNKDLAKRIAELSPRGGTPSTIDGLRKAIKLYEDQIERNVKEGAQTGVYWKILAIRLADKGLHNDALDAFERAIYYNSEDPVIYNLIGVSAGMVYKSIVGFSYNADAEKEHYLKLSENSYLRALELDDKYTKPMYGLGVLYSFEMNRPNDAIKHLEKLLEISKSDVSAMFVLARSYYMTESYSKAVELYENIIAKSKDNIIKAEASYNIDMIQRIRYE